ncbi:MAG: MarR family transcriptional regulator, partial [Xanthomonadales bacterium]|nr:MarR family transcriptional regulator [Xanthomonadales bacterium]
MPSTRQAQVEPAPPASGDFLDELGELALGSRLKRLADRIMADAAAIYRHLGHDMQPRWFTLLALLYRHGQCNVVEAAERLGLSQPAISQFSQQLVQRGLISSTP